MSTVTITRMANRLRIPASLWDARGRIARIFELAMFDWLEPALAEAGVDPDAEICIRRVDAFVRIRLAGTDDGLARAWSRALARAIKTASVAPNPDLVCYRSMAAALTDLVVSASRGDLSRVWAWSQLDLWPEPERRSSADATPRATMRALTRHPRRAVAAIVAAAERGTLARLFMGVPAAAWLDLARAVLIALAGSDALLRADRAETVARRVAEKAAARVEHSIERPASRILNQSVIAGMFTRRRGSEDDELLARGMAALAVAEVEPWRLQDAAAAAPLVMTLARMFVREIGDPSLSDPPPAAASAAVTQTARAQQPRVLPDDVRAPAVTDFGGLLFLLHAIAGCELPRAVLADTALASQSLRWVLHQLAMLLTGCPAADPAALAFAGLPPDGRPPDAGEPPITEAEAAALAGYAQQMVEHVSALFSDEPSREPLELIAWIVERHAEIAADPGWIEARFSLDSADTSIRRHGLDLNPDFLPWLGIVVRFTYA